MTDLQLLGPDTSLRPLPIDSDDPMIKTLLAHWQTIRQGKALPRRNDIDPTLIPRCLPHVWIYSHLPDEDDFLCRLAGAEINAAWGFSIMGKRTSQLFTPINHAILKSRWRFLLETPTIMHSRLTTLRDTAYKRAERLTLPLADRDGRPAHILGITNYIFERPQERNKKVAPPDLIPIYYNID